MRTRSCAIFLVMGAGCMFGAGPRGGIFAAEPDSIPAPPVAEVVTQNTQNALNAYLHIQEQLHAAQLAIESNRQEAAAAAERNTADLGARIQALEGTIATQRSHEIESTQRVQQLTLLLAVVGTVGLVAILLMVYFQLRAVARLAEVSAVGLPVPASGRGRILPMVEAGQSLTAPGRAVVEQSNARLLDLVDRLEKRILELEHAARAPLGEPAPSAHGHIHASVDTDNGAGIAQPESIADLLTEGQSMLDANEVEGALVIFNQALDLHPGHAEALVRKGSALERLNRFDEAIDCYNSAIGMDGSLTIAYLHKGGLFNRLARYEEALQCYEQALRTQEKNAPHEPVAS